MLEWFPGSQPLDQYLTAHGPLSAAQTRSLAEPLARALAAAHAKEVWHRDLKPANLLVRAEGDGFGLKVIDFGLAIKPGQASGQSRIARSLTGTLNFAPPEQRGDLKQPIGPWSDVYAYGKTLIYCLLGRTEAQRADWRKLEGEDDGLAEVIEHCVAWMPQERFQGFGEVTAALSLAASPTPKMRLRSEPRTMDEKQVNTMLKRRGFFDSHLNTQGKFANDLRDNGDGTLTDLTTGLMWQQGASADRFNFGKFEKYIAELSRRGLGGHRDWRLPTLEEAASLLQKGGRNGGLHNDPLLDETPTIWTADKTEDSDVAWRVDFEIGRVFRCNTSQLIFARGCRSAGPKETVDTPQY